METPVSIETNLESLLGTLDSQLATLTLEVEKRKKTLEDLLRSLPLTNVNEQAVAQFAEEPYVLVPKAQNEWYVIVPRFIDLQVGWLERQTRSFNVFVVDRYADWLGTVPRTIREAAGLAEGPPIVLEGDSLVVPPELQEDTFRRYKKFVRLREGRNRIRIRPRTRFNLVAALVKDGVLPFIPKAVDPSDIQDRKARLELRPYQREAVEKFAEYGNVGIFWMPAAGKTIVALYVISMLKGKKLIVVPSLTLVEQWQERIREFTDIKEGEYDIITYNAAKKALGREYTLAIYDECHHLPANVFSRLALIRTKYRLGLSATPYREDGRHELIFALTGFPIGLDWKHLLELKIARKPRVHLFVTRNVTSKIAILDDLVRQGKDSRTVVFCDRLSLGKNLARRYGTVFIHGATRKRLSKLLTHRLVVVSRVGDEGVSLAKLQRVIEFDFLFGSRRQELQRLGRLFHSAFQGEHYILMTDMEYSLYHKRLYSVYEKGIEVEMEQR